VSPSKNGGRPDWLWTPDDAEAEAQSADFNAGLASLGFIRAAIRRSRRFCLAMAAAGVLIGAGVYLSSPPSYQASTTLFLTVGPEAQPGTAIADDQAIIQSRAVAGLALRKLGLRESPDSFLASYTATPLTDRVIVITVSATSSSAAVSQANALAAAFLQYRANQLQVEQGLLSRSLDQQVTQAKQQITSLDRQISQASAQSASPAGRAQLNNLRTQRSQAIASLTALEQSNDSYNAANQQTIAAQIKQSQVLDAATPIPPRSRLKHLLLYAAIGLIGALLLALGIVVIRALTSEQLYRRDDVARALGAPVKLSIGKVKLSRSRSGRSGLAAAESPEIQRIAQHLGLAVMPGSRGVATLAVVPVDDPQVAALSLVSLALSCAQEGLKVIVADLCRDNPAARLLDVDEPGVHTVNADNAHLIVTVPDPNDIAPAGPLAAGPRRGQPEPSAAPLVAACASANLLLTLVSLDPSVPAEHLSGWADGAVAVVTAGRSSWTKIQAAGEMVRLAGTRLVSAVLVGADKTDESLGVIPTPEAGQDVEAMKESSRPNPSVASSQSAARGRGSRQERTVEEQSAGAHGRGSRQERTVEGQSAGAHGGGRPEDW
jgi:capsular polysaccharide biosynthesis protein